ncbi:MAG: FAD-binding and (Fe-S)-binding domain-containing protein, partial [Saprospiraceae bacterium]
DGKEVVFKNIDKKTFQHKLKQTDLEGQIYQHIYEELSREETRKNIKREFPKASIHRRNTGYAVDYLIDNQPFSESGDEFNFCKLLCGSEGTLAFTTEIKLHIDSLPDPYEVVIAPHFTTIRASMEATQVAMQHRPAKCELMDKVILDCTKESIEYSKNRYFIEGDPQGVLLIELRGKTAAEAEQKADALIADLQSKKLGYAFPKIHSPNIKGVWSLRSAGLGLLANIPGDKKAVACIEDTAVALEDLPDYIDDFAEMMNGFGQRSVYYAHAGAGEIHLRPILDLKKAADVEDFYKISEASAKLVKKYQGSLSGEHGDGRVRAAFIPLMVGKENYALFQRIKAIWDPYHIFNPGKIVDAEPMNTSLRYEPEQPTVEPDTILDFSSAGGLLRMAEKCNGSGDCRKLAGSGVMCPSYQATRNERDTTRGRANVLREFLTRGDSFSELVTPSDQLTKTNNPDRFNHTEIKEVMDLCISCKGCTSECPSNVDMASMKAEFLYQYQQVNGVPLRSKAFARINDLNKIGSFVPALTNFLLSNSLTSSILKKLLKVAPQRNLPTLQKQSLRSWYKRFTKLSKFRKFNPPISKVYLFCDEFTNYND